MPQLLFYLNVDEKTVINESMKSKSRDVFQNINSKVYRLLSKIAGF